MKPAKIAIAAVLLAAGAGAQAPLPPVASGPLSAESELRDVVDRYSIDRLALGRRYPVEASPERGERLGQAKHFDAFRAQEQIAELKQALEAWYGFHSGYDPTFSWWNAAPQKKILKGLDGYRGLLREKLLGIKAGEEEPIVGAPIGREALVADLQSEFIPYTPDDLLVIADREFAWCEAELKKAAREMGLGEDVKTALERVKNLYLPPGEQPEPLGNEEESSGSQGYGGDEAA